LKESDDKITDSDKIALKKELPPRVMLMKKLAGKGGEKEKLITLLSYRKFEYSGNYLKDTKRTEKLEKEILDELKKYKQPGTPEKTAYDSNDLDANDRQVIDRLILEVERKVADMRAAQKQDLPNSPSMSPLAIISIIAVGVALL